MPVVPTPPLGAFIARVMGGERTFLHPVLGPGRAAGLLPATPPARPRADLEGLRPPTAFLGLIVGLYILQRVQGLLLVNPDGFGAVDPYLALNTAVSFVTNTNWWRTAARRP